MRFSIDLFGPMPNPTPKASSGGHLEIDAEETSIQITTQYPGGFASATVGITPREVTDALGNVQYVPAFLPQRTAEITLLDHVEIRAGSALCFAGYIKQLKRGMGGAPTGFVAYGYAMGRQYQKMPFFSTNATASTTGPVLANVLAATVPYVRVNQTNTDQFQDPGVAHALADVTNMTAAQAVKQFSQESGYQFSIWNTDTQSPASLAAFWLPVTVPAVPDYLVPLDDTLDWTEDGDNLVGETWVRYGSASTATITSPVVDTSFPDRNGGTMEGILLEAGTLTAAAAEALATNYTAVNSAAPQYAIGITRGFALDPVGWAINRGLERWGGGETPAWLVRSGQWARIGEEGSVSPGPFVITRTDLDASRGTLSVKLGDYYLDDQDIIRELRNTQRNVTTMTSPQTGKLR